MLRVNGWPPDAAAAAGDGNGVVDVADALVDVAAAFARSVVVHEELQPSRPRLEVSPLLGADQQPVQIVADVVVLRFGVESVAAQWLDLVVVVRVDDELDVEEVAVVGIKNSFQLKK